MRQFVPVFLATFLSMLFEVCVCTQPNILFFMTDDQDKTHQSLNYMPKLNRLFRKEGVEFQHYYVPTGLCCPSRATILRGQYCHNTKVYDNGDLSNATYKSGAWQKFLDTKLEQETIATMMQSAGYETALVGKYMNGYGQANHVPPGFDHWMGMISMSFYGPTFSDNGTFLQTNHTVYQTDFIRDWVIDFLQHKRDKRKPFFLMVTPYAPHTPATPAKRHEHMFRRAKFPRYDSFNPSDEIQQNRPAWIKDMPPLTVQQIQGMDEFYRNRLRSLQAIDETLEDIVKTLQKLDLEDKTWFFYTADNGQHFGDFRIPAGKRQAYEPDVLVPFLVRGPGLASTGINVTQVAQSVDLAPTFLDLATQDTLQLSSSPSSSSYPMDGKSMVPLFTGKVPPTPPTNEFRWAALLEMYGGSSNIGTRYKDMKQYYQNHMFPNTYQAVRVRNGPTGIGANLLYVEWCTGEQELYNMTNDPHQAHNLVPSDESTTAQDQTLVHRLSKLLARLGNCRGSKCHERLPDYHSIEVEVNADVSRRSLQQSIRNRIPCFNPTHWPNKTIDIQLGRKPFAMNLPVPEPFQFGFPFSDSDSVPQELLDVWEQYQHYFY